MSLTQQEERSGEKGTTVLLSECTDLILVIVGF
jgi:hypothetical protein